MVVSRQGSLTTAQRPAFPTPLAQVPGGLGVPRLGPLLEGQGRASASGLALGGVPPPDPAPGLGDLGVGGGGPEMQEPPCHLEGTGIGDVAGATKTVDRLG